MTIILSRPQCVNWNEIGHYRLIIFEGHRARKHILYVLDKNVPCVKTVNQWNYKIIQILTSYCMAIMSTSGDNFSRVKLLHTWRVRQLLTGENFWRVKHFWHMKQLLKSQIIFNVWKKLVMLQTTFGVSIRTIDWNLCYIYDPDQRICPMCFPRHWMHPK